MRAFRLSMSGLFSFILSHMMENLRVLHPGCDCVFGLVGKERERTHLTLVWTRQRDGLLREAGGWGFGERGRR